MHAQIYKFLFLTFIFEIVRTEEQVVAKPIIRTHEKKRIYLQGGDFKMGVKDPTSKTGEFPVRNSAVKPFEIDLYPVTVRDFLSFKQAKPKYKTTALDNGFSWVFYDRSKNSIRDMSRVHPNNERWWLAVHLANWTHSTGFRNDTIDRLDHPLIHVSYYDANAYCYWQGRRLPTEYEWEYAARGGLNGMRYPWGDHYKPRRMNVWQGFFPTDNKNLDGYEATSPVKGFPAQNDYGMFDVVGNVWEWTSTVHHPEPASLRVNHIELARRPIKKNTNLVVKGGSFVDSWDGVVNLEARCSARHGYPAGYTAENVGFRCARGVHPNANKENLQKPEDEFKGPRRHLLRDTYDQRKRDGRNPEMPASSIVHYYDNVKEAVRKMQIMNKVKRMRNEL